MKTIKIMVGIKKLVNQNRIYYFFFLVHSWWPWRLSLNEGKCILRTQDGWLKRPCDELQAFICERDINQQSIPITVRCGNAQAPLSSTITRTTSTILPSSIITATTKQYPTVSFIQLPIVHKEISSPIYKQSHFISPVIPSVNTESTIATKTDSFDPSKI